MNYSLVAQSILPAFLLSDFSRASSGGSNSNFPILLVLFLLILLILGGMALFLLRSKPGQTLVFSLRKRVNISRKGRARAVDKTQSKSRAQFALPLPAPGNVPVALPADADAREYLLLNRDWLKLAKECVELFGELEEMFPDLDPSRQEIVLHIRLRLQEILTRTGLELIEDDAVFDLSRHRPAISGKRAEPGMSITSVVSPGFAVGRRVLRRARVNVDEVQTVQKPRKGSLQSEVDE